MSSMNFYDIMGQNGCESFLITGSTGFLGSSLVNHLISISSDIVVYAPVRDISKAYQLFDERARNQVKLFTYDSTVYNYDDLVGKIDYIIHCAAPTSSKFFVEHPVETITSIMDGTERLLRGFSKDDRVKSIVYLSSLEVYGDVVTEDTITEEFQGYINPLSVRSSYPMAKRLAETLCAAYVKEYGMPIKIARLTQICGPGVDLNDNRVFAQFCRLTAYGLPIELKTEGKSARPYCYITDTISAILTILLNGVAGVAYNVANPNTYISVRDLANKISSYGSSKKVEVRLNDDMGYANQTYHHLSTSKLEALGWQPIVGLDQMITSLINYFKENEAHTDI